MKKALFIDKDGTLIKNIPHNGNSKYVELEKNVGESLSHLSKLGYIFLVISNQSGIARGLFTEDQLQSVFEKIQLLLKKYSVTISRFYYCPHFQEGIITKYAKSCSCRKPSPGLIRQAAIDYDVNLSSSWMIGDILTDIESGNRAGCKTILINNGNENEWHFSPLNIPAYTVPTFHEILEIIRSEEYNNNISV